jgi:molybdenum cofactor cytidylyltransferase
MRFILPNDGTEEKKKSISAVLLAAGLSRRMGVDKLSLPWKSRTILEESLRNLCRSSVREVIVVVSEETRKILREVRDERVRIVLNPVPEEGMGGSIREGVTAVIPGRAGILVALGDQPLLDPRTVNCLVRAFVPGRGQIVLPVFRGRRGHPVLFDRCYRDDLLGLHGDVGGRAIVERFSDRVTEIRTQSEAVIRDFDTWKDYVKAFRMGADRAGGLLLPSGTGWNVKGREGHGI